MATAKDMSLDEEIKYYASPNQGDAAAANENAKALKSERKIFKLSLTRALNEAAALVRRKADPNDVAAQRQLVGLKLTELESIQSRYLIAIGEGPDDDSDGYMLDVRKNFHSLSTTLT